SRRVENNLVPGPQPAGSDLAGDDAPVVAGAREFVDVLDEKAQRLMDGGLGRTERVERVEDAGSLVPRRLLRSRREVVAVNSTHRDEAQRSNTDLSQELAVLGNDPVELGLGVPNSVHFVYEDGDLLDAQH